ncbi:MAG: hypothetical protein HGB12_04260 [Bacteroidetes bacterium]|nr:hypothetical protein [Bacteroidota bacterium]
MEKRKITFILKLSVYASCFFFSFMLFITLSLLMCTFHLFAQNGGVAINITGNPADNSAMLDVNATGQGMLIPRLSTLQRDSIAIKCSCVPATGLQIYNTTTNCFEAFYGNVWQPLSCLCSSAPVAAGSISGTAAVCPGQNAVLYSVPAINRATNYIWSYSGTGAYIVGSTNAVIVYFSVAATSGNLTVQGTNACGNGTVSADYPIAVNSTAPNITVQPASMATCLGSGNVSFTVTASGGLTYQWQEFVSSWNNVTNAGVYSNVTSATLTITNPPLGMDGYKYRCVVNGTCTNTTSDGLATLTVNPVSVGGTASATLSTLCSGSSTTITLTGNTGAIQWQQSANGTSGWANVSGGSGGTIATYTTPDLTSTTYYRAQITSGVCNSAYSTTVSVAVDPVTVGGTATATASTLCSGSSTTITLTGSAGTIQWQQSADGTSGWANVSGGSGGTTATFTTPNLTTTTYYKAQLTSGVCTLDNSTTASVTVNSLPVAPTSANVDVNNFCSNAGGNITLTAVGGSGTTLKWYTVSCGGTLAGTGASLTIAKPTTTTTYYARWETANCGNSSCESVTVTVNVYSSGSQTFNYTGSQQTFTVPVCISSVSIKMWGAGGGGGGTNAEGAGAGAYVTSSNYGVTPGANIIVIIGQGGGAGLGNGTAGLGGTGYRAGGNGTTGTGGGGGGGGSTSFGTLIASGGGGGAYGGGPGLGATGSSGGNGGHNPGSGFSYGGGGGSGTAGAVGAATTGGAGGTGGTTQTGTNGDGNANNGAGGGSSAGTSGNGNTATGGGGASGGEGGAGSGGAASGVNGAPGESGGGGRYGCPAGNGGTPGGGGGGAYSTTSCNGGSGGNGQVIVSW